MSRPGAILTALLIWFATLNAHAQPSVTTVTNPQPILSPELLPGFFLADSSVTMTTGRRIVREYWHSRPADEVRRIRTYGTAHERRSLDVTTVSIVHDQFASHNEALEYARERLYVDRGGPLHTGSPGLASGRTIGDYCWTNKHEPLSILFLVGRSLVRVSIDNSQGKPINPDSVEDLAFKVLNRIEKTK